MAKYPGEIYEPREKENRSGVTYDATKKSVIFKEDISKLDDEVVAVEEFLGLPAGQAGKMPKVKETEDGFEYEDPPTPGIAAGWELIKTGAFSNSINIQGLDGDADKVWMLIIRARHSATFELNLRFNGDATANNYACSYFGNRMSAGAPGAIGSSFLLDKFIVSAAAYYNYHVTVIINALSGQIRMMTCSAAALKDSANFSASQVGASWLNTADNITVINIISGAITAGEYWLFKKKE